MKVILKSDIKSMGKAGDVRDVADGYARNYLLPRGLAVEASAQALNDINNLKAAKDFHTAEEKATAEAYKVKIDGKSVTVHAKAGSTGRLFGAVTSKEVADALHQEYGVTVDKRKITCPDMKNHGEYAAGVKFYTGVVANVTVIVAE